MEAEEKPVVRQHCFHRGGERRGGGAGVWANQPSRSC